MTIRRNLQEKALLKESTLSNMMLSKVSTSEELTNQMWLITKEIFYSLGSIDALIFRAITVVIAKREEGWSFRIILEDFDGRREIESKEMLMKTGNLSPDMKALKVLGEKEGLTFISLAESEEYAFSIENT